MGFEIGWRLFASVMLAALIKGGVALAGHSIAWVWAAAIALLLVFGGWLILSGDVID